MKAVTAEVNLNRLLAHSLKLEEELLRFFDYQTVGEDLRESTTSTTCSICFEHARSVRLLVGARHLTSAVGVLRLQYEALVRANWVYFAATDKAIGKLSEALTPQSEKTASRLPMMSEMMKQVERKAPAQMYQKLEEIKQGAWQSMNSFTHSGIHAIHRHEKGYPLELVISLVKHSNGMSSMAAILFYQMVQEPRVESLLDKVRLEFEDCLPINRS